MSAHEHGIGKARTVVRVVVLVAAEGDGCVRSAVGAGERPVVAQPGEHVHLRQRLGQRVRAASPGLAGELVVRVGGVGARLRRCRGRSRRGRSSGCRCGGRGLLGGRSAGPAQPNQAAAQAVAGAGACGGMEAAGAALHAAPGGGGAAGGALGGGALRRPTCLRIRAGRDAQLCRGLRVRAFPDVVAVGVSAGDRLSVAGGAVAVARARGPVARAAALAQLLGGGRRTAGGGGRGGIVGGR